MSANPARILAATGVALGVVLLLSRSGRPRKKGNGQRPAQEQEGLPQDWPAAVTLGMGRNEPSALWVRSQAPAEIVTLAAPLEEKGLWPGRLGPFLALMAHSASGGDPRGPGGWFGLTPDIVFTGDLASLRPFPDLLKEPRFAVLAAARRIHELQRRYPDANLTWLDVARIFVPKDVPEEALLTDRPAVDDASGVITPDDLRWGYQESKNKYMALIDAMEAYDQARKDVEGKTLPWMSQRVVAELPPVDNRMLEDQLVSVFPYDANDLLNFMGIKYQV